MTNKNTVHLTQVMSTILESLLLKKLIQTSYADFVNDTML